MFNTQLFNTFLFNTGNTYGVAPISSPLVYNGYNFDTEKFRIITLPDIENMGELAFNTWSVGRNHGEGLSGYFFKRKNITVQGVIRGSDRSELETNITALKAKVMQEGKKLKYLKANGIVLETTASCTLFEVRREHYHINFAPVMIVFTTLEPFFYSSQNNIESWIGQTSNISGSMNVTGGNYQARPRILINFASSGISSVTSVEVDINGVAITISETISNSDQIEIDCKNKDVSINGSGGVDYTGTFPTITQGEIPIDVTINGTWDADIYVIWQDTYV